MKQYIKSKSIRWFFKFWFRCLNKLRHLYQMSIYSYKKQTTEFNLNWIQCKSRETLRGGVLNCHFWQPFQRANICRETVWKEHLYYWNCLCKQKANAKNDWRLKNKNRRRLQIFLFKTLDNRSVQLLSTALEGTNDLLSVQRKEKRSATKSITTLPLQDDITIEFVG